MPIPWLFSIALLIVATVSGFSGEVCQDRVGAASADEQGVLIHEVQSRYQAETTTIRVLLPDRFDSQERYNVLFVLPVEAHDDSRYGDGLLEIKQANLHNTHRLICVAPTFSHLPWYADHPNDPTIRQESYFVQLVVPFVDRTYPTHREPQGRLLVGFSKSGWGAFSLLLRHPDVFGKAAAWDAPLMKDLPNQFGMESIFGSQTNFEQYRVTALLKQQADKLGQEQRLVLLGYGNFRQHHLRIHKVMNELGISHAYRDGPQRTHHWDSGWLSEAVELLAPK